jgi:hypothetical protein
MSLRKVAFGFAPNTISNCGLWLDAADISTLFQDSAGTTPVTTNGQPIGLWRDKSGAGHDFTQATSVNRVSYDTSSKAAIQLSSPTFLQASAASLGTVSTSANLTIIMTASTGPSASWQIILAQWFTGTTRFHLSFQSGTDLTPALYSESSGSLVKYNFSGTMAYNRTYTIGFIANGTSLYMSFMGTSNTTTMSAALSTNPTSALTIADSRNFNHTDGKIQEVIIYPYAISTTEFQQVESYLAQKWGLTSSLPVGHPGLTTTVYRTDYNKNSVIVRNVTKPIPYYTQFSPRQISGLGLWLDAADSSTVTGTSPITAWNDKSGAGRTVTITSGPTYGTTSRGGNRTMSFNNNTITTSIASAVGTGDFTLVAVWYQSAAGTNTVLSLGTVASSSQSLGFSGNKYNFYQFGDVNESAYSTATPSWVVQIGTRIGSVKKVYINGNLGTTPSSTSYDVSVTTVTIGKGDNFAISGEIGEILIYTGTMSDTNRQLLESYLAQKWGLTASLPGGHSHFTQRAGAITTVANTKFSMVGVPRISSISFSPTSIAGLQMWMDAADSSSDSMTLSGLTVTVWKDKSGLGNHTTARSGTSTLTSNAINGKSAISMAGGYFTGPFATANTGTQVHAFAVLTIDSSTGQWARPFALGRPGVNDYSESTTTFAIIRYNGTQAVGIGRAGQYLSVGIPAYSSPFLVQSSHNVSTEYMSVNGNLTVSSAGTGQSGNFNITSYGLGVNTNTGDYFALNGYYGEVMYFNVQLSDTNRQKIEGYLAWKWGLQASLPVGHPYALAAP